MSTHSKLTSLNWLIVHPEENVHGVLFGLGGTTIRASSCSLVDIEKCLCVFGKDLLIDELILLVNSPELVLHGRRDGLVALICRCVPSCSALVAC